MSKLASGLSIPSLGQLDNRGRPPKMTGLANKRQANAWRAYVRLANMAKDKDLQESHPRLVMEINQWLYEVEYGRPHISLDQRIASLNIQITGDDLARSQLLLADQSNADNLLFAEADLMQLSPPDMPDSGQTDD